VKAAGVSRYRRGTGNAGLLAHALNKSLLLLAHLAVVDGNEHNLLGAKAEIFLPHEFKLPADEQRGNDQRRRNAELKNHQTLQ
jgi:hypothetical protein